MKNENESEANVAKSILDALNSRGHDGRSAMTRLGWRQPDKPIYDDEGFEIVIDDRIYRIEINYIGHE